MSSQTSSRATLMLLVTALAVNHVQMYPGGAPDDACSNMIPMHHVNDTDMSTPLIQPQTTSPYFTIIVNTTDVAPNGHVTVTIKADQFYYEGFFLQAKIVNDSSNNKQVGTFMADSNNNVTTRCNSQGITHSNNDKRFNTSVVWMAPGTKVYNIRFKATVVKGYATFFTNVYSQVLNPSTSSGPISVASLSLALFFCLLITIA